ncbi:molybdopterin-dependent oxidoreductase [Aeromicrobium marinum]|nr:molybdopterin-dependent oxidoreductase [Aeromicrobium marinum]
MGTAIAALINAPSPIVSIGNRFIFFTPQFLKEFAIRQFGTADKPILIASVSITLLLLAMVAGVIGLKRRNLALGITFGLGAVAILAAATDNASTANAVVTVIPTIITTIVAVGTLLFLLGILALSPKEGDDLPSGFDRRKFLIAVGGTTIGIALGGLIARVFGGAAAAESRMNVRIPTPADPASAVPAGVEVDVQGVSSYITPNRDFYRIDTALQIPDVPVEGYSLRIHGMVDKELNLSFQDLLEERLIERRITLTCVSNEVGGPYVGNATWIGIPVRDLLERAGVQGDADAVQTTSADGMTISTPLGALDDENRDAIIAIAMNGEPLPLRHGFPVRMVVPGLYGYVSATKWLVDIEVTRFADHKAYWSTRGYDEEAPIKFSSRIDVPESFQTFPVDAVRVGGVAWAQNVGIERIEVQVDGGEWVDAELAAQDSIDTWRQWSWQWDDATPGNHQLTVRATNADGETQTSDRVPIAPNGSTGLHSVQFRVE